MSKPGNSKIYIVLAALAALAAVLFYFEDRFVVRLNPALYRRVSRYVWESRG